MIEWRKNWAARCRRWTESVLPGLIKHKMAAGTERHGPHFGHSRDPLVELRDELIDASHYLHAAADQRHHLLRVIERLVAVLQAHQKPKTCDRCTATPNECSSVEEVLKEAREAIEDTV